MRKATWGLCIWGWMLASTALAQAAGDPVGAGNAVAEAGPIKDLETLVVTGVQPGPGLWRVSHEGNVLWILGTVSPLPAKMKWESAEVEAVIADSQQVLLPPSVTMTADVGPLPFAGSGAVCAEGNAQCRWGYACGRPAAGPACALAGAEAALSRWWEVDRTKAAAVCGGGTAEGGDQVRGVGRQAGGHACSGARGQGCGDHANQHHAETDAARPEVGHPRIPRR